jgi:saccharopine dehydrogenase-like NADP-dependent oxidoreductase
MRVLVLGVGSTGSSAARTVNAFPFVQSTILADLNQDEAARLAHDLGEKASAVQIDVSDTKALAALFGETDVILNTVGPFYRFGVPVLKAAIEAGKHYADINDDWQPTLEMLALHESAVAAGVTAVIGLGASPGISNMLALTATKQLDSTDILLTGWDTLEAMNDPSGLSPTPSAALIHWLHQTSGTILLQSEGQQTEAKPLQEIHFHYPGYGEAVTWSVGHPEPVTLPRTLPLQFSANVMTGNRDLMTLLQHLSGEIDTGAITLSGAAQTFLDLVLPQMGEAATYTGVRLPSLFAIAFGEKDGTPMTAAAALRSLPEGGMGGSTGVPLALFAALAHQGSLSQAGVYPPEAILTPQTFVTLLASHIDEGVSSWENLIEITSAPGVRFSQVQPAYSRVNNSSLRNELRDLPAGS